MEKVEISDSESEFWLELDKQVLIDSPKIVEPEVVKTQTLESEAKIFMETVPVAYYRERMEKLVSQIRIASQMQLESQLLNSTKSLTKKHSEAISALKQLHSDEVKSLKEEFLKLEKKLKEKDSKISTLERFIIDQEQNISFLRVDKKNKYSEEEKVKELESLVYTNKMTYDMQVTYMKEVVEMYKKDADKAIEDFKALDKRFNELEDEFAQYRKDKLEEFLENKRTFDAQIRGVHEKYEYFKMDVEKELNIRFVINKRQNEFIEVLKKELKNAKTVIETPRLNAKYLKNIGRRGFSLAGTIEEENERAQIKVPLRIMHKKNSVISSSFSTSASPIYSNASEIDISSSHKYVGVVDSKYH